ncbi:hypothetical protein M9H77_04335 [Catharanthus roseus]|uniref:Uncharacterized protein n=1 Tax=Catharanthus roseus TaxID=4058 RepID=A0ACC0CDT0_CATRO|nr:hypothetical protein M9H77_04335 [Catharanthus roseus]
MYYEVSLVELELFLESYLSHVSIYGHLCAISFGGGLFLIVAYASTCISAHAFLEDSLLHSDSMFDPPCHDFGVMNNASIESILVGFRLCGEDSRMNLFKGRADDENRMSQSPMEWKLGPITRAQRKKLKIHEDNGMISYIEEALKRKLIGFEGQDRASKLFVICSISKDQTREQIGGENG